MDAVILWRWQCECCGGRLLERGGAADAGRWYQLHRGSAVDLFPCCVFLLLHQWQIELMIIAYMCAASLRLTAT
jgi:hypothetical protein